MSLVSLEQRPHQSHALLPLPQLAHHHHHCTTPLALTPRNLLLLNLNPKNLKSKP
jgi:hypothetical protein